MPPEIYDLIIDHLADDLSALSACALVSRAFLPRSQHHLFRHVTFYPPQPHSETNRCARFPTPKAPLVESLTIFERRLPLGHGGGMRTNAWTEEALPRVLPLLVALRSAEFAGQMYLDERHRVRTGVQGVLPRLTSLTLDGVYFSNLAELGAFFGCMPRLKGLVLNVMTVGRRAGDRRVRGGLCGELETLEVGIGHLHPRWIRYLLGRDGVISLESLRELVYPLTLEADSWLPGVDELVGRAPRLEKAVLVDSRGGRESHLFSLTSRILIRGMTPVPDTCRLRSFTVFAPLDRSEVRWTKVDVSEIAVDWTRTLLGLGPRLEQVVILINAKSKTHLVMRPNSVDGCSRGLLKL